MAAVHHLGFFNLWGFWTDLHQMCTECGQNFAIEHFKIGTAIFESVSECQPAE